MLKSMEELPTAGLSANGTGLAAPIAVKKVFMHNTFQRAFADANVAVHVLCR